jgi:hypothetical protein
MPVPAGLIDKTKKNLALTGKFPQQKREFLRTFISQSR